MTPDSLTPFPADAQVTDVQAQIAQIGKTLAQLEQESQSLKVQAAQKDQQAAAIRVQLATLAGTKAQTVTATPQIGQTVEGKGVYMGVWQPKNRNGKSLGKTFAVYAATEDLTDEFGVKLVATFRNHAKRMTALKDWHGHNGFDSTNDATIIQGLADGSAVGKWFIPTRELLTGTDRWGDKVQDDNLLAHQDKLGAITTSRKDCDDYEYPNYYISSAEHRDDSYSVCIPSA